MSDAQMAMYVIGGVGEHCHPCKIGVSSRLRWRLSNLQTGSAYPLGVYVAYWFGSRELAFRAEKEIFKLDIFKRLSGEWFDEPAHLVAPLIYGLISRTIGVGHVLRSDGAYSPARAGDAHCWYAHCQYFQNGPDEEIEWSADDVPLPADGFAR
jgi:hypothetical protein